MECFKLYNIIIDPTQIIGVGPLRRLTRTDPTSVAYQAATFQFQLFTKSGPIIVTTDELSFIGDRESASKVEYQAIQSAWKTLQDNLLAGIDLTLGYST